MTQQDDITQRVLTAEQDPINAAILLLTEEADSISDCHTRTPGDWAGEPESKAHYDHVRSVVDALSKLRAPVADERSALAELLEYVDRNTCTHEDTHRGGAIWTICDGCGMKWADDEGGFAPHQDAPAVAAARAALASAPVDPEATEVDFLVRVFENLDTWRAEDWNELLERRPAILAMLRPLVLASAPVAGEQIIAWDVQDTGLGRRYTTYNPKVAEDLMNLGENVRPLVYASALPPANAAPQASAENALMAPADVAQLVAFIFDRFGQPGDAGALPDNVAAAVRRLERGIKAQADKDGGQWEPQTPGQIAADMRNMARSEGFDWPEPDGGQQRKRYVVLKASGSRYAYVNDTQEGRSINRFDVLKGDGWKYAHEFADRMNKEHERAALSAPQAEQGERDA